MYRALCTQPLLCGNLARTLADEQGRYKWSNLGSNEVKDLRVRVAELSFSQLVLSFPLIQTHKNRGLDKDIRSSVNLFN